MSNFIFFGMLFFVIIGLLIPYLVVLTLAIIGSVVNLVLKLYTAIKNRVSSK